MTEVVYSDRAVEWLENAEQETRERIVKKLDGVKDFPEHYLKRLSDSPYHRQRVGDYRVIIDWQKDKDRIFVREIHHREGAYD